MTITEILATEHIIFLAVFARIEDALRQVSTVFEVRTLAGIVHGLLEKHANTERELAYAALDHLLAQRGSLDQMYQDHDEIDQTLRDALTNDDLAAARHNLRTALSVSRRHFCFEEVWVFPLIEKTLQPETLVALGKKWAESAPAVQLPEGRIDLTGNRATRSIPKSGS